jgi:hypothetical protein
MTTRSCSTASVYFTRNHAAASALLMRRHRALILSRVGGLPCRGLINRRNGSTAILPALSGC